jgi:hypothetical protein
MTQKKEKSDCSRRFQLLGSSQHIQESESPSTGVNKGSQRILL